MVDKINKHASLNSFQKPRQKNKDIAIVDDFKIKDICIDFDFTPDISHGEMVKRIIQEGLPQANIDSFQITKSNGATYTPALKLIVDKIQKGHKYDALNLSMSTPVDFTYLSKKVGKQITPDNVLQNRDNIKKWIYNEKDDKTVIQLRETLEQLDKISDRGVQIYVAAGNEGKNKFNLLSLAKNTKIVGSIDSKGQKTNFTEDNSFVKNWDLGIFPIKRAYDSKGKLGFDYTGDGSVDIYAEKTTSWLKFGSFSNIKGTSISCPRKLTKDLKSNKK